MKNQALSFLFMVILVIQVSDSKGGKSKGGFGKAKVPLAVGAGVAAGAGIGLLAGSAGNNYGGGGYGHKSIVNCYQCESRFTPACNEISYFSTPTVRCGQIGDSCVKITELSTTGPPIVIRGCGSSLLSSRTDFPREQYDGCRYGQQATSSAPVTNSSVIVTTTNINTNVMYCFCRRNACNTGSSLTPFRSIMALVMNAVIFFFIFK